MNKTMKLYGLKVRRDALTTTPVNVPAHEVPILQTIFGEENVHNRRGQSLAGEDAAELSAADVVGEVDQQEDEFLRLERKYGGNDKGSFVEQVYGKKATRGLEKRMASDQADAEKAAKAKSKADDK
jgi:hypothetical protein